MKAMLQYIKYDAKKNSLYGECFTGKTLVCTKRGYVAIKDIRKGEDIFSRDAVTGETGLKEVEDVFQTGAHTIYRIELDGKEEIETTAYHPIFVEDKGWVTAINLHENDLVQTLDATACITRIEKDRYEIPVITYNLHVKDWVSFFVTKQGIYVHNGECLHIKKRLKALKKTKKSKEVGYCNSTKELIIQLEGQPFLTPRINDNGTYTIGYGYDFTEKDDPTMFNKYFEKDGSGTVKIKRKMTEQEAEETIKLAADKKEIIKGLDKFINGNGTGNETKPLKLSQNQYDALFSFFIPMVQVFLKIKNTMNG